jgi:stage II sporulation protein GA (sporulation sigma-E factor processing peptidase)
MIIYIEAIFGLNFCVDLALLWLSGRCLGLRPAAARLLAAAAAGAGYALAVAASPGGVLAGFPAKLLVGALMLAVAYRPGGLRAWARLGGIFALASTAAAGFTLAAAAGGAAYLTPGGAAIILGRRATRLLPVGLLLAGIVAALAGRAFAAGARRKSQCVEATVEVDGRSTSFCGLVDTGNELCDPVSGLPVLVAEASVLAPVVPGEWREALAHGPGRLGLPQDDAWLARLCLIPYRTVASRGGMLVGFRPDRVLISSKDGAGRATDRVVVAACPGRLGEAYRGIIPPSIAPVPGGAAGSSGVA